MEPGVKPGPKSGPPEQAFMKRVAVDEHGCWVWQGKRNHYGYGRFYVDQQEVMAHRWAYEHWIGPIPPGLVIDHYVCNRGKQGCVNPHHCRPETLERNSAMNAKGRQTQCKRGHQFTEENTYRNPGTGRRQCRTCMKERPRR